jgi:hypothetical protein
VRWVAGERNGMIDEASDRRTGERDESVERNERRFRPGPARQRERERRKETGGVGPASNAASEPRLQRGPVVMLAGAARQPGPGLPLPTLLWAGRC